MQDTNILYMGCLSAGHGLELLTEAFLLAHAREPRLHLLLAGDGPAREQALHRLGAAASFLGDVAPDARARVFACSHLLVVPSGDLDQGQVILAAQAGGLPVLAVDAGAGTDLIQNGRTGYLVPESAAALGDALFWLGRRARLRERLAVGALLALGEGARAA